MGDANYNQLGKAQLRIVDVVAQSIGFMGPVFSVALLIPLIVGGSFSGHGAGVTTPFAIIIAAAGTFALAWMISRYAHHIATCGALYDYVSQGVGRRVGFVAGWAYYGAAVVGFCLGTVMITAGIASDFLASSYGIHIDWWILGLGLSAVMLGIVSYGVRLSTRAQLVLVGFSAVVVFGFSLYVIARSGLSLQPFNPSASPGGLTGIFYGVIYGVALFIGFETAANLAEETSQPKRAIPRALFLAIGLGALYYVICAYAQAVGFGLDANKWAGSVAPLVVLAGDPKYGSTGLADAMQIMVLVDALAVGIGAWTATSRGIFSLARDRRIPNVLARTHPSRGTPVAAALLIFAISVTTILVTHFTGGLLSRATADPSVLLPEYLPLWIWIATFGPFLFILVYLTISVTGVIGLWKLEPRVPLVVAGVVGGLLSLGALFGLIYQAPDPLNKVPYFALGWVVVGAGLAVWFAVSKRAEPAPAVLEAAPGAKPAESVVAGTLGVR